MKNMVQKEEPTYKHDSLVTPSITHLSTIKTVFLLKKV